jgi:hypothetical protein
MLNVVALVPVLESTEKWIFPHFLFQARIKFEDDDDEEYIDDNDDSNVMVSVVPLKNDLRST